jgi:energy-coupling factor transport system ATP-binding protein
MPIVIDKLNFTYMPGSSQEYRALTDISLTIEDGEFFGIIGHTGSGKSTFIQHLNGLILPTSGSVSVDGFRMEDKKQRAKGRRLVGMVFQYPEYQLFEETVEKDIAYGPGNRGLSESEISDRVREAMELVGLPYETFREKSPFELSGGEKRRAALAGIIAMRPKYLVLDEPMAGLDPRGRKNILNTIRLLREHTKCGIIMVSHSMDDIAGEAERIAVLDSGKLRQVGTPKEIFSDSESLLEMGLDLPQVSRLALELRKGGVTVPDGLFRLDEMKEFLLRGIRRV